MERTLEVKKASQTITFGPLSRVTFGVSPITLSGTSSAGLPVTFSVFSGPGSISGNTLTVTGAGSIVVRASQAGNPNYQSASSVQQPLEVDKASQTISFGPLSDVTFGVAPLTLSASGGASGNPVTFRVISGPGSLSGNTLTVLGGGSILVQADQASNNNYAPATPVQQTLVVNKAIQTITFNSLSPVAAGVGPITLSGATSSSGLPVTFRVFSGPGSISGNTLTVTGAGRIVVQADQAGDASYAPAPAVQQTLVVNASLLLVMDDPATPGRDVIIVDKAPAGEPVAALGGQLTTHADQSAMQGLINLIQRVGSFGFTVTGVMSQPLLTGGSRLLIGSTLFSGGAGTLEITATDTGYLPDAAGQSIFQSPIQGMTQGTVTFQEFVSLTNTPLGGALTPGLQGPFTGVFADSRQLPVNFSNSATPFALTKKVVVVHEGAGITGFGAFGILTSSARAEAESQARARLRGFAEPGGQGRAGAEGSGLSRSVLGLPAPGFFDRGGRIEDVFPFPRGTLHAYRLDEETPARYGESERQPELSAEARATWFAELSRDREASAEIWWGDDEADDHLGSDGDDVRLGGAGDDLVLGGLGLDLLVGELGRDG